MKLQKNNIRFQIQKAFSILDENARIEALGEILDQIEKREVNLDEGINEIILGMKKESKMSVLSYLWDHLKKFPSINEIRNFAEKELNSENPSRRRYALIYLAQTHPEEREKLYIKMSKDLDSMVLFEVGKIILPLNPKLALETWLKAFAGAPHALAEEILPLWIGQYADEDFTNYLKQLLEQNPNYTPLELTLWFVERWNSIEYLDAKEPVKRGEGYFITCPNCEEDLGVREGHVGERARCRLCQHEFIIPERPKE